MGKDYNKAIIHFDKALLAMKMLFDNENDLIQDRDTAIKYI